MSIPCKMRPVGFGSLPVGYTRLDFLESTGGQYLIVDEPFVPRESGVEVKATKTADSLSKALWGVYGDGNSSAMAGSPTIKDFWSGSNGALVAFDFYATDTPINKPVSYTEPFMASVNWLGERKVRLTQGEKKYEASDDYYVDCISYPKQGLFAIFNINNNEGFAISTKYRIHNARFSQVGVQTRNLTPCLDPAGTPLMFDLVTRQSFLNNGTGSFIAGMTMVQVRNLASLPVTEDGTLTVSLPWEAQWDAGVQNTLTIASAKGWTITVQYRDPEAAMEGDWIENNPEMVVDVPSEEL